MTVGIRYAVYLGDGLVVKVYQGSHGITGGIGIVTVQFKYSHICKYLAVAYISRIIDGCGFPAVCSFYDSSADIP